MIKKIAWDTFKKTGDINTFLEFKQIEEFEKEKGKKDGECEIKWNNIIRK